MSANLPTVQVDDYEGTLEAFGGAEGYREWLRAMVADRVAKWQRASVEAEVEEFRRQRLEDLPPLGPPADAPVPPLPEVPGSEQPPVLPHGGGRP